MEYTYQYPRAAVTVDIALFSKVENHDYVLLIRRDRPPFEGCWALPGGFIEMDETLLESALRELEEETGLKGVTLKQFNAYGDPGRDPRHRTVTIAFIGVCEGLPAVTGMDDAREAAWHPVEAIPSLGFDHKLILNDALKVYQEMK
ncbi:MAG: NUDIX hydrolase [Bacteroidetes bacterium]|nr:NUDIX hydrolase [Bacteroidota bacterium]